MITSPLDTHYYHSSNSSTTILSTSSSSFESLSSSSPVTPTTQVWPDPSPLPPQQLVISLVGAKHLRLPPGSPLNPLNLRPYAVLQFDHTDSITDTSEASSSPQKPGPRWRSAKPLHRSNHSSHIDPVSPSRVCPLSHTHPADPQHPVWNHVAIFDIFKPRSSLFVSIYHHHPSSTAQEKTEQFLGGAIVDLRTLLKTKSFDASTRSSHLHPSDSSIQGPNSSFRTVILDDSIDLWNESGETKTGSILIKIEIKSNYALPLVLGSSKEDKPSIQNNTPTWIKKNKISMDDFEIITLIGEGSYGQVYRVRKKDTRRLYAMKTLEKRKISITPPSGTSHDQKLTEESSHQEEDHDKIKLERVLTERKILEKTRGCEFLVGLKFSFQTNENLNLIMDLKSGGELMSYMQRFGGRFDESWVVFYTAEILSGLKFLHSMNIAYRDLKPENCLLDATGHVALCDFGLSKLDMKLDSITKTFCGTTEYIAPEVLLEQGYTRVVDFWSLGVLIFEMSVGWTPFFSENRATRYSLILESDISTKFPKRGISDVTKNIILCLLEREPSRRLGSNGMQEIETHEFFKKLDWKALIKKRITPPFKPRVASDSNLSYANDPIYSYGGRSSNSAIIDRQFNQILTSNYNHHPNNVIIGNNHNARSKNHAPLDQFCSNGNQLSRRSSVEQHSSSASIFSDNNRNPNPDLVHTPLVTVADPGQSHFRDFTFSRDTD